MKRERTKSASENLICLSKGINKKPSIAKNGNTKERSKVWLIIAIRPRILNIAARETGIAAKPRIERSKAK